MKNIPSIEHSQWSKNPNNSRIKRIKQQFLNAIQQHSNFYITYYQFLLAAKTMNFRFASPEQLIQLKKYFNKYDNHVKITTVVNSLLIKTENLKNKMQIIQDPIILVRFGINDGQFDIIKEDTSEDEEIQHDQKNKQIKSNLDNLDCKLFEMQSEENRYKIQVILMIKVQQILKKIKILMKGRVIFNEPNINIINSMSDYNQIPYEIFLSSMINLVKKLSQEFEQANLYITKDDIKAIFMILDSDESKLLNQEKLKNLNNVSIIHCKIKNFYSKQIDKQMIKNTQFKMGQRPNSQLKIYKAKPASMLELQLIQKTVLGGQKNMPKIKKIRLRSIQKNSNLSLDKKNLNLNYQQIELKSTRNYDPINNNFDFEGFSKRSESSLLQNRNKLQKILKKNNKNHLGTYKKNHQTMTSKLRSLFIHNVILPREKILQQQKKKYSYFEQKSLQLMSKKIG